MNGSRRLHTLLCIAAVVLFVVHAARFLGGIIDDAYISFRYARNLVHGLGLVFNEGERVEGFTNFSWVMLSSASLALGIPPVVSMPLLGTLAGVGLVLRVARSGASFARDEGRESVWAGIVAAAIVAITPGVAFYAVSGLEETFFALLTTCAALALVERRLVPFALWTCAAFLTRPEAALLGFIALFIVIRSHAASYAARGRAWLRELWGAAAVFGAVLVPYLGFKLWYFGALLPNTMHAKEPALAHALEYTGLGLLPSAPLALVVVMAWVRGELSRKRRELFVCWGVFVVACALVGPDWMPAYRFFVPIIPLLALAADGPVVAALSGFGTGQRARSAMLMVALCIYAGASLRRTSSLSEATATWQARDDLSRKLARSFADIGVRSVATINIGLLAYEAPDVTFTDLAGLVDREIARGPGGHLRKRPSDAYLLARDPDLYVLTSSQPALTSEGRGHYVPDMVVERHVFTRPWFLQRYAFAGSVQFYARHYYHLFHRRR